jgi:prepilin-type N-terminal cleavage/methylation domain-containing protein
MHPPHSSQGFTLIELLIVIAIIALLAGIVANIAPMAIDKGKRSRAQAEIAAIELALENYKTERGEFPAASIPTTDTAYVTDTTAYISAGNALYGALRGGDPNTPPTATPTFAQNFTYTYFQFKANQVSTTPPYHMIDPYRRPYGYSSRDAALFNKGLFDFWSTGSNPDKIEQWIKNWSGN